MGQIQKLQRPDRFWQAEVVCADNHTRRIGPKLPTEQPIIDLVVAIRKNIDNGSERWFRDVCIVEIGVTYDA